MSLRIAFDLDGVLADLTAACARLDRELAGGTSADAAHERRRLPASGSQIRPRDRGLSSWLRGRDPLWQRICDTEDFWRSLSPLEPGIVERLDALAKRYGWEVFFVTQRPKTTGETVQRQTQRWLVEHGFELPSVMVMEGSRGKLAEALRLDFLVDDLAKNCVDVISDSNAKAVLVLREENLPHIESARKLGIEVVRSVAECLDLLEDVQRIRSAPRLKQLARAVTGNRAAPAGPVRPVAPSN